jgi:hypothetical protein
MTVQKPGIGEWYRVEGGDLFEVIAIDDADGSVDLQYFDGTLEEMALEDWHDQCASGAIKAAEAPEDYSGTGEGEGEVEDDSSGYDPRTDERRLNASGMEGLDLFE